MILGMIGNINSLYCCCYQTQTAVGKTSTDTLFKGRADPSEVSKERFEVVDDASRHKKGRNPIVGKDLYQILPFISLFKFNLLVIA